jgi:lipid A 4'-phosphatase
MIRSTNSKKETDCFYFGLLAVFLIAALIIAFVPRIDLGVSRLFYTPGEGFVKSAFLDGLRRTLNYQIAVAILLTLILEIKRIAPKRATVFIALTYALGPGLLVNGFLKEYVGRARPSQIEQFGGTAHFTPAFVFTNQCAHNCSFTAGDPSIGFALIAFAFLFPKHKRALIALALLFGFGYGLMRIMQGGHFLSDVLATGFVTIASALILYKLCFREWNL